MINYKKNLPDFVEGAKEYPLIQLCSIYSRSPDYYKPKEMVGPHEGAMIIQSQHIVDNHLVFKDMSYYSWKGYNERPRDNVEVGNILLCKFAAAGSPFKSAVVTELPEPAITNVGLYIFKEIKCLPEYLQLILSSSHFQEMMKGVQNKGSVPNVTIKALYTLSIPVPSEEEQEKLVKRLVAYRDANSELIKALNTEINLRNAQMDYHMNQLLWK